MCFGRNIDQIVTQKFSHKRLYYNFIQDNSANISTFHLPVSHPDQVFLVLLVFPKMTNHISLLIKMEYQ